MNHTPTPYHVFKPKYGTNVHIVTPNGEVIAVVTGGTRADETAEFIVCACNHHNQLLKACLTAVKAMQRLKQGKFKFAVQELDDAIESAAEDLIP